MSLDENIHEEYAKTLRGMTQAEQIRTCFVDDNARLMNRMQEARELLEKQNRAADLKSYLVDQIRSEKLQNDSLAPAIAALESTNKPLFDYIKKLEYLNYVDVYCYQCKLLKKITGEFAKDPKVNEHNSSLSEDEFYAAALAKGLGRGKSQSTDNIRHVSGNRIVGETSPKTKANDITEKQLVRVKSTEDVHDEARGLSPKEVRYVKNPPVASPANSPSQGRKIDINTMIDQRLQELSQQEGLETEFKPKKKISPDDILS
jgi:hypothetical protein